MKCEKSSVCCNKKSNFLEPVPIVDGVAVPDSVIDGVFVPDSSGDDSEPESDILIILCFLIHSVSLLVCFYFVFVMKSIYELYLELDFPA